MKYFHVTPKILQKIGGVGRVVCPSFFEWKIHGNLETVTCANGGLFNRIIFATKNVWFFHQPNRSDRIHSLLDSPIQVAWEGFWSFGFFWEAFWKLEWEELDFAEYPPCFRPKRWLVFFRLFRRWGRETPAGSHRFRCQTFSKMWFLKLCGMWPFFWANPKTRVTWRIHGTTVCFIYLP